MRVDTWSYDACYKPATTAVRRAVTSGPNLLHLALIALALPCVRFTLNEARHRALPRLRLYAPPLLAVACAVVFLGIDLGAKAPLWRVGLLAVAGFAMGAIRGFTLRLEVDHDFQKVRLPRARGSFMIALALLGAVLLEVGGAFAGEPATALRQLASEIAVACAAMLTGRALAIRVRWNRAPYVNLRRA